jgi:hypothetical protein
LIVAALLATAVSAAPVHLVPDSPAGITQPAPGIYLVDFARVAFANLSITAPAGASGEITIHFGEALSSGRIDRKPPGTVRYASTKVTLVPGKPVIAAPPPDARNTKQPAAVLTPKELGVLVPFRWVEIEGWPAGVELKPEYVQRRCAYLAAWDDAAASFKCSDDTLTRIWELCRYSIKATTFAGIYVDGDRERIAYEADAYLTQISHYCTDNDLQIARDTYDRLMAHPTWPTEWAPHMVFMAHADWMRTADTKWLAPRYEALKSKLLLNRAGPGGLVRSNQTQVKHDDIVDWPTGERDGYVFTPVNTVVNAFHLRSLAMMAELAAALHKDADAADYSARYKSALAAFNDKLFDPQRGVYRDGEATDHASQHASLFPLAFGLVPADRRDHVAEWLAKRGMACSPYAAQYLMEALFENGQSDAAVALMIAPNDRSWRHMLDSGTTISWEAWDQRYKPNQDWNHAWGAAPANLLPRYVVGVQPLEPGWRRAAVRPNPAGLKSAEGKVPTPRGPVLVAWERGEKSFTLRLTLPQGMPARVQLPTINGSTGVTLNGQPAAAKRDGAWWVLDADVAGTVTLEVK